MLQKHRLVRGSAENGDDPALVVVEDAAANRREVLGADVGGHQILDVAQGHVVVGEAVLLETQDGAVVVDA